MLFLLTLNIPSLLAQTSNIITVNSLNDVVLNDGLCTLREAINAANSNTTSGSSGSECAAGSDNDVIDLSGLAGTLLLDTELPILTANITFQGPGSDQLIISRNSSVAGFRVFTVSGGSITIDGLHIMGGEAATGAALLNQGGTVVIRDSLLSSHTASSTGGAIYNATGTLTVIDSVLDANMALSAGGAVYNAATFTATNITFSNNESLSAGGVIYNDGGTLTITGSTMSSNRAGTAGGAVFIQNGTINLRNSTLSGNIAATAGGGLYNQNGMVTVNNITVASNTANAGGGIGNDAGIVTLGNTLLANNSGGDCIGSLTSSGHNLIQAPASTCAIGGDTAGNILSEDALIEELASDGGLTRTHALLQGSPAIDAGNTDTCEATDQRGNPRPYGGGCDIGAFESDILINPDVPLVGQPLLISSPANGEDGVAVTRETILRFRNPINPASVTDSAVTAWFGQQQLTARTHISSDAKTVTLFYSNPLPPSARVRVQVDGNIITDSSGVPFDVDGDKQPGGVTTVSFDTLGLTVIPGTSVCGRVFASELDVNDRNASINVPLQGVTITVDARNDLRAITGADGNFCLDPAPAGEFFVHIDGRTATNGVPAGAYYPFVGKSWVSLPGRQASVGDIFLPLVVPGTLQTVSETTETTIQFADAITEQFPEFEGVQITVPANSLFADDGTTGGMVGIAPVPPDRLPGQLPPGLNFPIVITVQTDGATNFDVPAPICFPNLPDETTGQALAPGEKSTLWSFNHDTGRFEISGPMTVSADGKTVCSDPGYGVTAPGWHGSLAAAILEFLGIEECSALGVGITVATNVLTDVGTCAAGKTQLGQIITGAYDVYSGARDGTVSVYNIADQYENGQLTATETCNALSNAQRVFSGSKNIWNGVKQNNPVSLAASVATCATSAGSTAADSLCNIASSCRFETTTSDFICNTAKPLLEQAKDVADKTEAWLDSVNSLSFESIDAGISAVCAGVALGNDIDALIDDLVADLNTFDGHLTNVGDLIEASESIINGLTDIETGATKLVQSSGQLGNGFYNLQIGRLDRRGNTSISGHLSLTVTPLTPYVFTMLDLINQLLYISVGVTGPAGGRSYILFSKVIELDLGLDFDTDGLPDQAEIVIGTITDNPDTDGDGINDGAEIEQGTNPLDGLPTITGIIASTDTAGNAVDVCIADDLAIVADSNAGVASFFNIFNGMTPTLVNQIDTPRNARVVACSGDRVAVDEDQLGLLIMDVSDPTNIQTVYTIDPGSNVLTVSTEGTYAYVGTADGRLLIVNLQSGLIEADVFVGGTVQAVSPANNAIFVLTNTHLYAYSQLADGLTEQSKIAISGGTSPQEVGRKLFVGGNYAYVGYFTGYTIIDVSDPANLIVVGTPPQTQLAIHDLAHNGSDLLLASTSFAGTNTLNLSLYDVSDPTDVTQFLTSFETPGEVRALEVFNGLAYVADGSAGLQVMNYLSYDSQGVAPSINLDTNIVNNTVVQGSIVYVYADVADDVQVRNVEFIVNGETVFTDGVFPFEYRFPAPNAGSSVVITARATDTGGNRATSAAVSATIVADTEPPTVTVKQPFENQVLTIGSSTFTAVIDAKDNVGIGNVAFNINGNPVTAIRVAWNAYNLPIPSVPGIYQVSAVVSDINGLSTESLKIPVEVIQFEFNRAIEAAIDYPDNVDTYIFEATQGQTLYFDEQSYSPKTRWRLVAPDGTTEIFNQYLSNETVEAAQPFTVTLTGTYILTVYGDKTTTQFYRFQVWELPAGNSYSLSVGDSAYGIIDTPNETVTLATVH